MVLLVKNANQLSSFDSEPIPEEVTDQDREIFERITNTELTPEQREHILHPEETYPYQKDVLAVHWHPEYVPIDLAVGRIEAMFPTKERELIIPTQHNELVALGDFCGVEVDCYSRGFNQKVQLLLHFHTERLASAPILRSMIEHTGTYRASQLFEFMRTITGPVTERLQAAARETGAGEDLVSFVRLYVRKIEQLLEDSQGQISDQVVKNKLLRNFFNELRPQYGDQLIDRAQAFLKAVKELVKAEFPLQYFYRTSEIIEEARLHGAGIVVPHPEQFWPILLAEYDVDGYEVWNPQSRRYTDFLITVVNRKNLGLGLGRRRLLIFMGDDTHLSEKVRDPGVQDRDKAAREIGLQPAWDDLWIRKKLIKAGVDRPTVIKEYTERLI